MARTAPDDRRHRPGRDRRHSPPRLRVAGFRGPGERSSDRSLDLVPRGRSDPAARRHPLSAPHLHRPGRPVHRRPDSSSPATTPSTSGSTAPSWRAHRVPPTPGRRRRYVDLAAALKPGTNTLPIAARNTAAGPAGVLGRVRVATAGGTVDLVTDACVAGRELGAADLGRRPRTSARTAARRGARDVGLARRRRRSPVTLAGLTTERQANPVGPRRREAALRLAAASPRANGQIQGRYQVTVGTDAGRGRRLGQRPGRLRQTVDIAYGGPRAGRATAPTTGGCASGTPRAGASPWSAGGALRHRLLDPAAWQADFIGAPATANLTGANWIWYPEGDPAVSAPAAHPVLPADVRPGRASAPATLVVTGDDTADVWVNGTQVSTSRRVTDSWKRGHHGRRDRAAAGGQQHHRDRRHQHRRRSGRRDRQAHQRGRPGHRRRHGRRARPRRAAGSSPASTTRPGPPPGSTAAYGARAVGRPGHGAEPGPVRSRKGFDVAKPVARARLFATALGLHDTYLNGAKVGEERLAPGWTDYNKRLQYRVLRRHRGAQAGRQHAVGALVGNGWYSGNIGFAGNQRYGASPVVFGAARASSTPTAPRADVRTDGIWSATASDDRRRRPLPRRGSGRPASRPDAGTAGDRPHRRPARRWSPRSTRA